MLFQKLGIGDKVLNINESISLTLSYDWYEFYLQPLKSNNQSLVNTKRISKMLVWDS